MLRTRAGRGLARIVGSAVVLLASSAPLLAQRFTHPPLDPRVDTSASGGCALHVQPSSPRGGGKATYRLERGGQVVWSAELPFTLWESAVADDGTVAGYAYGHGIDGWSGVRGDHSDGGFRVVILDPAGSLRLDLAVERGLGPYLHQRPQPEAAGLLLDDAHDLCVIRVQDDNLNRNVEQWWPFRLSTGEALPRFHPKEHLPDPEPARWVVGARPVRGTPLFLVHWWTFAKDRGDGLVGARFTLVDITGTPVWTLDLPGDYSQPFDEVEADRLQDAIRARGAILACSEAGRFELGLVATGQRVIFGVDADAAAQPPWKVTEVARAEWSWEVPPEAPPPLPEGRLEQVGTLELGGLAAGGFGRIGHFDLDDRGRFGFTRDGAGSGGSFLLVGPGGEVLLEQPLDLGDADDAEARVQAAWITDDRWLLHVPWPGGGNANAAWWLDAGTQRIEPIEGFAFPAIVSVDGDHRGGFVALGRAHARSQVLDTLAAFDSSGSLRWQMNDDTDTEDRPHLPEAVAVAPDGRVGVLDKSQDRVLVYDREGAFEQVFSLESRWGWEPYYPSNLASDEAGGWIVHDALGPIPLVRMSAAGDVLARVTPTFADGRRPTVVGRVAPAPDGGLWASDRHAFLHVSPDGRVDRIVGRPPDDGRIDSVASALIDARGRIVLADERTGAVHVFGADGTRLALCRPAAEDELLRPDLALAPDGRVFVIDGSIDRDFDEPFITFSPEGERIGTTSRLTRGIRERWLFQPEGGRRWVVGYEDVALVDADGKTMRHIDKRPDGTWLRGTDEAGVAPDGSLALISDGLCLYAPDGEPRRLIALPQGTRHARLAFDGKRAVLATQEALFLVDTQAAAWTRYPLATQADGFAAIGFAPDGERIRLAPAGEPVVIEVRMLD